ncbi:DUF350 domain-containing protein [Plesiomonas sp.]|uniref:DUF350 domain-containing protein n=1 Tax=Plesiomonas sp. TaxID=2486279 RepID=UPI003F37DBD3
MSLLSGLGSFALYFSASLFMLMLFKWVYVKITPYDEWTLVKEEKNVAAAITLSGAFIGYSLAIASAASNSVSVFDFIVWGIVAMLAQVVAFLIVRFGFMPSFAERITNNETGAAILMASMSISVGLLNAACMTY